MKSKLIIATFALVCIVVVFNENKPYHNQFKSDACGYYLYLPAVFIYHDLSELGFYQAVNNEYHTLLELYNINGKILNKYPVGVCFFELPLFFLAHIYCIVTHQYNADGFTLPYQLGGIFSNILWVVAGLFVLRRFLKRYFNDNVTAITLICVAFGTNLYTYSGFELGMSHPYSFFLFSCILSLTDAWYKETEISFEKTFSKKSKSLSILIGITLGFICIVRPVNIIIAIIPAFWRIHDLVSFKERIRLFRKYCTDMLLVVFFFCAICSIQLAYWKFITGHWLFYSYLNEGFSFLHPQIWNGLLSYRKGWFLYTPMSLISLSGFYYLWKKDKTIVPVLIIFILLMIYITFSWREWWYGGGFGCRPLIEAFALLSLPIAAIADHFYHSTRIFKKTAYFILFFCIISLNIFQSYQYSMGLINWSKMTRKAYWYVFGKVNADHKKLDSYLIKDVNENNLDN